MDICPDASPIIGPTPVDGLYINCGWGTGGFETRTGVRLGACRHGGDRRARTSWPGPYALSRFESGALIDEHGAAGVAH